LSLISHCLTVGFTRADEAAETDAYVPPPNAESFEFQAEVNKMMDIVINSLYQNKDVFLRELISNASDALDKIRFLSITDKDTLKDKEELEVRIMYDQDAKSLTITDSGIGMTKDELVNNLGTVARSGTTNFLSALQDGSADMNMIGQFGVGFYSAFLVADRVRVASKSANDPNQHIWESQNGESNFIIAEDPRGNSLGRGTEITLYLKEDAEEYADPKRLKDMVKHYSEFITHPIHLRTVETMQVPKEMPESNEDDAEKIDDDIDVSEDDEGKEDKELEMEEVTTFNWEKVNSNQAIWARDKDEITDNEYQDFWKVVSKEPNTHATTWSHFNAEGNINFRSILYLPEDIPQTLKFGNFKEEGHGLKLYVRKVLISDTFELLPRWLAFIKGVVDSDDLPLNVNRETLQESKIIKVIGKKLARKAIEMMKKFAEEKPEKPADDEEPELDQEGNPVEKKDDTPKELPYITWYKKFAPSLKMGVIEDDANRSKLAKLLRYKSSKFSGEDDWISLDDYISRMDDKHDEIFFFPGENIEEMKDSNFMDTFIKKGIEVLYFDDPVDEYVVQHMPSFDGKKFQAITKEGVKFKDEDENFQRRRDKVYREKFRPLTKFLKKIYGNQVSRVVISKRLGAAPAVVSSADWAHSANMERVMKAQAFQHGRDPSEVETVKVLEINPRHPFVTQLLLLSPPEDEDDAKDFVVPPSTLDAAWTLLDMSLLNSGFGLSNVKGFSKRMTRVLKDSFGLDTLALEDEIDVPEEEDVPDEPDMDFGGMNMEDFNMDGIDIDSMMEEL
jgi:heat shock protein beta